MIETISAQTVAPSTTTAAASPAWGCSLFTAFADPDNALYGRNFDWNFSPAVLLYTDPPDGYAAVSMVDIAYLGFSSPTAARTITDLSLTERAELIYAPLWPFDGMNETGLVIGMAAVPGDALPVDPARETIGSLGIMRDVLDHARTVDEAVAIFERYNIDMEGGPTLHYLIADASGRSVLIEFWDGEMIVQPNAQGWDMATNFVRATAANAPESMCWRYRTISAQMSESAGHLTPEDALGLLSRVAQPSTQWSIVYGMASGEIRVAMHGDFDHAHTLYFSLAAP
jgi:penicillin V acylase-like amidase (Ntn superfamily)